MSDDLKAKADAFTAKCRQQDAAAWDRDMDRLREVGGLPEPLVQDIVQDPDGLSRVRHASQEARLMLLQAAQDPRTGNPSRAAALEAEITEIRQQQREAYARSKGRIR